MSRARLRPAGEAGPVEATAETRARLRPDPLLRLHREGKLSLEQLAAAEDIRRIYEGLTLRLGTRAVDLAQAGGGGSRRRRYVQPFERMAEPLYRRYRSVFRPWAAELERTRVAGGPSPLGLVLAILVEGATLGEAATRLRLRRQEALAAITLLLDAALARYARRAGYLSAARPLVAIAPP